LTKLTGSKNFLIFLHETSVALQINTYLRQYFKDNYNLNLFIFLVKNKNKNLIKDLRFIFKDYQLKIFEVENNNFNIFSIKNITQWSNIFKSNKSIVKNIDRIIKKKFTNLNYFDQAFYTNDRLSRYFLTNFKKKKIYFFHGIGDYNIFQKKNLLKTFKNNFILYLNKFFNRIYLPNKNCYFSCVYCKKINFNDDVKNINLNINLYKENFFKFLKYVHKTKKIDIKKNFILILLKFPRYNSNKFPSITQSFFCHYLKFILIKINNYISHNNKYKNLTLVFKTKNNINSYKKKILINIAKKVFYDFKLHFFKNKNNNFINSEYLANNYRCKLIISNFSTSDFITKIINPNQEIVSYHAIVENFYKLNLKKYKKIITFRNLNLHTDIINYNKMYKNL
jgi:hypothetical protein